MEGYLPRHTVVLCRWDNGRRLRTRELYRDFLIAKIATVVRQLPYDYPSMYIIMVLGRYAPWLGRESQPGATLPDRTFPGYG